MALNSPHKKTDKELIKENEYDAIGNTFWIVKKIIKLADSLIIKISFMNEIPNVDEQERLIGEKLEKELGQMIVKEIKYYVIGQGLSVVRQ